METYARRIVDADLDEFLPVLPAIALEGAKGVGKTLTARRRADTAILLDDQTVRAVVAADPVTALRRSGLVLVDEWQRVPAVWDAVRRRVDDDRRGGQFLLTGSAKLENPETHSGAGRIVTLRMRPMSFAERALETPTVSLAALLSGRRPPVQGHTDLDLADYAREIVASGLPGLRGLRGRPLTTTLDAYTQRVVDRDLPELGAGSRRPDAVLRWMRAVAAATATTASWETIRDAATPGEQDRMSRGAAESYRAALERLWVLDSVPAWLPSRNHLARLAASPKHHLLDPALAARLLGADADALVDGAPGRLPAVRDTPLLGQLFESLVTLSVQTYAAAADARVRHLRTRSGDREVDLVLERADHRVLAVEVKLTTAPAEDDVRHLLWLQKQLGPDALDLVLVNSGRDAYRRPDGIAVVPLALLGP